MNFDHIEAGIHRTASRRAVIFGYADKLFLGEGSRNLTAGL